MCKRKSPDILAGIGDDAAAVKTPRKNVLITSDMMIEGIHFDLSFTSFYQLGYKFLAINISDILAMGGDPQYFIVSMGLPESYLSVNVEEMYSGMMKMAKKFDVAVIGGDTCASKNSLVLSGTLIGSARKIIKRSGAAENEGIFVTDNLGDSAMGLVILQRTGKKVRKFNSSSARSRLIKKHLMPEPSPLENITGVTSMIDISDGLLMDLGHICDESKVGAVIYKDRIPISRELKEVAGRWNIEPVELALNGGEDYALLFTAPRSMRTSAVRIGEIVRKGRFIVDEKGKKKSYKPEGYEHFKKKFQISKSK